MTKPQSHPFFRTPCGTLAVSLLLVGLVVACQRHPDLVTVMPQDPSPPAAQALTMPAVARDCPERGLAMYDGETIAEALATLHNRMYVIGETSGERSDWEEAIACAGAHIDARVADGTHIGELTEEIRPGLPPLVFAAENGYPRVVEVLLQYESVRLEVDRPGPHGLTPWQVASLAPKLAGLVLNPGRLADPFSYVPLIVQFPFYTSSEVRPYESVLRLLEAAGATTDDGPARELALGLPGISQYSRRRIRDAADLLEVMSELAMDEPTVGLRVLFEPE